MFRHIVNRLTIAAGALFVSIVAFAADPTIQQVYDVASSGHLARAQQMMDQVLRDHPASGKAHFVEAELLAKQGNAAGARSELATAEHLAPGLPFANPGAVRELNAQLTRPAFNAAGTRSHAAGMQWGVLALVLLSIGLMVFLITRRRAAGVGSMPYRYAPTAGPAPYGGYGNGSIMPSGGGLGSGLLGGLATGAAVGAGVVAGEALMHRVLDGGSSQSSSGSTPFLSNGDDMNFGDQSYDMGGNDFGLADDSSWDDGSSNGGGDGWN